MHFFHIPTENYDRIFYGKNTFSNEKFSTNNLSLRPGLLSCVCSYIKCGIKEEAFNACACALECHIPHNSIESMHSSMIFYDIAQHLSKMKDRVVRTWYHATMTHNWALFNLKKH